MRTEFWLAITCPMLLGGCAGGMIPGTICSSDGKVMSFEIEKAHRTGMVRATDPSSGEKFIGNYVGIKERLNVNSSSTATSGSAVVSGSGHGSMHNACVGEAMRAPCGTRSIGGSTRPADCLLELRPSVSVLQTKRVC